MKKHSKRVFPFFLFLMLVFTSFGLFSLNVSAANITIETWEDYSIGVSSGNGAYLDWYKLSADDFVISNARTVVSGKTLEINNDATISDTGYLYIQYNYSFINSTTFYVDIKSNCYERAYIDFIFYDDHNTVSTTDDTKAFAFRFLSDYVAGQGRNFWYIWLNDASGWHRKYSTYSSSTDYTWRLDVDLNTTGAVGSRYIDYEIYNMDTGLYYNETNSSNIGYTTWDYIKIVGGSDGGDSIGYVMGWLDNILIDGVYSGVSTGDILYNYIGLFGDSFIEFYGYDEDCYYRVGDNPIIVYNVSDVYDNANTGLYKYEMVNKYGNVITEGYINANSGDVIEITDFSFPYTGSYYLLLFNLTSTFQKDAYITPSLRIIVCDALGGADAGGDVANYDEYIVLAAFFSLILVSAAIAYYIGWMAFPFALFGGLVFLSTPGHSFNVLPPVVLLVSSLVLVIAIMLLYTSRR